VELRSNREAPKRTRVYSADQKLHSYASILSRKRTQMTTRRALTRLAFLAMAGSALMSSTGIANAITPQDNAYLAKLSAVGLTWPPTTEEALIGEAHLICYDLTWGWQPQLDVGTMVDAAHKTYCPGNVCDAPTLCT
jgi:hypothetical protein